MAHTDPTATDAAGHSGPFAAVLAEHYRIERELGAGGMATVYLAEGLRHHRRVAIKVLHPELSAVLGPERFLKEIELTANLPGSSSLRSRPCRPSRSRCCIRCSMRRAF